ncbi:Arylsulfatase A [Halorubrum aquaticum]|uniref:Arylsulfatase A n=1 Tax=Halorubrum aquaticum TaxID=387340 RepID=A0A1I3B2K3_9EURY|nr:sulfatase-like hydrolase/transferase [Halorubrum aquaticum]SFH56555.1 Arylsulfatase A [Halorubrum aquaticum]
MGDPNVLLVILDSVRARNVGHLGYPRETTPRLDAFADGATTYTNAKAPGIHSISSHVSLFTGYHVAEHRVSSHGVELLPGHTVWETLSEEGYRTGLFTPNAIVAESSNLASFFDHVVGPRRDELVFPDALGPEAIPGDPSYLEYLRACLRSDAPFRSAINGFSREFGSTSGVYDPTKEYGGEYVSAFLEWRREGNGPWAACLNLMDAHYPYLPLDEFDRWGGPTLQELHREAMGGPLTTQYLGKRPFWELVASESLYDDCIRQVDAYVGTLLEGLTDADVLDDTLVVITSDHGEGFGEYSALNDSVRLIDHSWGIGDELAHVPLVVKRPDQDQGETVKSPASLTQFPSVVDSIRSGRDANFVPPNGDAITTSYRVQEPGDELPLPADEREPYFGPWHAVCHEHDETVVVDAIRRDDGIRYEPSSHRVPLDSGVDNAYVEDVVDGLGTVRIDEGESDLENEVERRLHELGYMT